MMTMKSFLPGSPLVMIHRIGNSVVRVLQGDICRSTCEVIVSSDDSCLTQGGGVSYAIACAGGSDIRNQADRLTPVELGDVAVTTAGRLSQKYVFHAVTIDLESFREIDETLQDFIVRNSVRRCFRLMSQLRLLSIAFPVIGTGAAGIPPERACRRMVEVFSEELGRTNQGMSVELWIFGASSDIAESVFRHLDAFVGSETELLSTKMIKDSLLGDSLAPVDHYSFGMQNDPVHKKTDAKDETTDCPDDGSVREVFISYCRQDSRAADWVCKVLKSAEISYWRDVDGIYSGQNFKGVIARAIRAAHTVFFLSSANSNASEIVIGEIGAALHFRKHIVPIKLDTTEYHDNLLMDLLYLDYIDVQSLGRDMAAEIMCKVALLNRANSAAKSNSAR